MEPDLMDTETPDYFSFLGKGQAPKKKRKRGGLAGLWDRNKNVIKPLATVAAGALTGGAAVPALLGAAMGGLDRPGRGGVGFDLGGAAVGGLQGYGMGKLGQMGAQSQLGQRVLGRGATAVPSQVPLPEPGAVSLPSGNGQMATPVGNATQAPMQRGLNRALQFIEKNPQATGMGLQALSGVMGSQEQRRIEEARQREERRRAENLARLAMPMYVDSFRGRR